MNEGFSENVVVEEIIEKKHSGIGITSFILGIISIVLFVIIIIIIASISIATSLNVDELTQIVVGLIAIIELLVSITGGILGIISVCMKNKKKLYGIMGICFNLIPCVLLVGLFILGISTR